MLQILVLLCSHLTHTDISEVLYTLPTGPASDGCYPPNQQSRSSISSWQMEGADPHWNLCNSAEEHTKNKAQSFVHPALGLGGSKSHTSTLIHQILCPATPFVSLLIYSETRTTCSLSFFLFAVSIKPTSTALLYAGTGLKAISTLCLITALHCTRTVLPAQFGN